MVFRLKAPDLDMLIMRRILLGAWVFTKTAPPIFPSPDIEDLTLHLLKMNLRIRTPVFSVGTFSISKLYFLQTWTFWVLTSRNVKHTHFRLVTEYQMNIENIPERSQLEFTGLFLKGQSLHIQHLFAMAKYEPRVTWKGSISREARKTSVEMRNTYL